MSELEIEQPQELAPEQDDRILDDFQQLAPQYVSFERRTNLVVGAIVLGILFFSTLPVLYFAWQGPITLVLYLVVALFLLGLFIAQVTYWPALKFRTTSWRHNETGFEIHRGVWWKHQIAIPAARVQHVDVSQGPIQRLFDLSTLTIHTAGTKNASVELEGLEHASALLLRDQLIEQKESLDVT